MDKSKGARQERLDTLRSIELAEGVEIQLRTAGPYVRVTAYLIDLLIRVVLVVLFHLVEMFIVIWAGGNVAQGVFMVMLFALLFLYYVFFEAGRRGASPGKRLMGLRVVDTSGAPISLGQSFVRNILRFADGMPLFTYGFGLFSVLATQRFQRLGDLLANTLVVYDRQVELNFVPLPPSLEKQPPRVALSREEQAALVGFCERAGGWSEARREEIADHVSELTGKRGSHGVSRLSGIAGWLNEKP